MLKGFSGFLGRCRTVWNDRVVERRRLKESPKISMSFLGHFAVLHAVVE